MDPTSRSPTPTLSTSFPVSFFPNSLRTRVIIDAIARDDSVEPRIASSVDRRFCDRFEIDDSAASEK